MKLSNPTAIKVIALILSGLIRMWLGTLRMWFAFDEGSTDPLRNDKPTIYLFWHEALLLPAHAYARFRVPTLIGLHRDGELIAQVVRMLRGVVIRGSTDRGKRRGGVLALRAMLRQGRFWHLSITADGPVGPRRQIQAGIIYLASRSGMRILPVGIGLDNPWRLNSWDKLALPRPFSRAVAVLAKPISVPGGIDRGEQEEYRLRVQASMDEAQRRADRLAEKRPGAATLVASADVLRWPGES